MKAAFLGITLILIQFTVACQVIPNSSCFRKSFTKTEKVFTKMENLPHFKGYDDKLTSYLINELDIEKITTTLSESTRLVSDTIHVKFIISKAAVMSDLDIQSSNLTLTSEFRRVFIKSACNWIPGYSNRNLNGWYSSLIYFTLDRRGKFLSISVKIQ